MFLTIKNSIKDIEQFGQRLYFNQDSALYHGCTEQNWDVTQRMIISKTINIKQINITNQQKTTNYLLEYFTPKFKERLRQQSPSAVAISSN